MSTTADSPVEHVELAIQGMTCASCANRIERKLSKLDGAHATVNYATEKATVDYDATAISPAELVAAVQAAGYEATLPTDLVADEGEGTELRHLRLRLIIATGLSVPVLLLSMIPALQFDGWQWVSLVLATPVVFWAGWTFHRAAWQNARHGTATMDTLISVGTLAAWSWSVVALLFLNAGMIGMKMPMQLVQERGAGTGHIYFEAAAVVTTLLLAGRYFEARAKRRSGAALRALLELGAKDASVLDADGSERRVAVEHLVVGDRFVVRPGRRSPPTASSPRVTRRSISRC